MTKNRTDPIYRACSDMESIPHLMQDEYGATVTNRNDDAWIESMFPLLSFEDVVHAGKSSTSDADVALRKPRKIVGRSKMTPPAYDGDGKEGRTARKVVSSPHMMRKDAVAGKVGHMTSVVGRTVESTPNGTGLLTDEDTGDIGVIEAKSLEKEFDAQLRHRHALMVASGVLAAIMAVVFIGVIAYKVFYVM